MRKWIIVALILEILNACCNCPAVKEEVAIGMVAKKDCIVVQQYDPVTQTQSEKTQYILTIEEGKKVYVSSEIFNRLSKGDTLFKSVLKKEHFSNCKFSR